MEPLNCIEKFYSPAPEPGRLDTSHAPLVPELELPVNPEANWPQTLVGPEVMLLRCEANLGIRNGSAERARRRLADKCPVEFVMS